MNPSRGKALSAFISYAHKDEEYRRELDKHLAPLRAEGLLAEWHDRLIGAGVEWNDAIDKNLNSSNLILILLSPDFLESDYCTSVETKRALQRHQMQTARVIPIIIRPCMWERSELGKLQAIPAGAKPVSEWSNQDTAFKDISARIRDVCIELQHIPGDPSNPYRIANIGDSVDYEGIIYIKTQSRTMLVRSRQEVVSKTTESVTVRVTGESEVENIDKEISISLALPFEDSMAKIVSQVSSSIPKNAQIIGEQTSAGEEKLFIGQEVYYTTWTGWNLTVVVGIERFEFSGKTWLCPDIPLDGIVKSEMDNPVMRQSTVVVDYERNIG